MGIPKSVAIELPLPPSTNNAYVNIGKGRSLSPVARKYKREVRNLLMVDGWRSLHMKLPLSLSLWFYLPDNRRRDITNMVKLIEDAVAEFMAYDDSRNEEVHLYRRFSRDDPRVVVKLEEV